ncbi:hypothetical protein CLV37_10761 [Kineococcus rhizosphaerae]|uniref:Uncharacterized protein n=1 Tax=Kineococcus rhizosphaerae TaxID=559628 RepID=A0A2T0R2G1_9ACTN|nr:hypothetical protein CLV37_10761 [Kineococcus rhizosphaerae]
MLATVFVEPVANMLSGYRVMSRRFVKSFPAISRGFEVETELTVHAINLRVPQAARLAQAEGRITSTASTAHSMPAMFPCHTLVRVTGSMIR